LIPSRSNVINPIEPYTLSYTNPFIYVENFTGTSAGEDLYAVEHKARVLHLYTREGVTFLVLDSIPASFFSVDSPTVSFPFIYSTSIEDYPVYAYFKSISVYNPEEDRKFKPQIISFSLVENVFFRDAMSFLNSFYAREIEKYQQTLSQISQEGFPAHLLQEYLSAQQGLNEIYLTISRAYDRIIALQETLNAAFETYVTEQNQSSRWHDYYMEITSYIRNNYSVMVKINNTNALYRVGEPTFYEGTLYVHGEDGRLSQAKEVLFVRKLSAISLPIETDLTERAGEKIISDASAYSNVLWLLQQDAPAPVEMLEYMEISRVRTYFPSFSFGEFEQAVNFHTWDGFVRFGSAVSLVQAAFKGWALLKKYDELIATLSVFYPERAENLRKVKNKLEDGFLPAIKWLTSYDKTYLNHYFRDDTFRKNYCFQTLKNYYLTGLLTDEFYLLPFAFWEEVFSDFSAYYPLVNPYQVFLDLMLKQAAEYDRTNVYRFSNRIPVEIFDPSYITYLDMIGSILDVFYFRNDMEFVDIDIKNPPSMQNLTAVLEKLTGNLLDAFDVLHDSINRILYHTYLRSAEVKWLNTLVESLDLKNARYQFDIVLPAQFLGDRYSFVENIIPVFTFSTYSAMSRVLYGFLEFNEHRDVAQNAYVYFDGLNLTLSVRMTNANPQVFTGGFSYPVYTERGELIASVSAALHNASVTFSSVSFHGLCNMRDLEMGLSLLPFAVQLNPVMIQFQGFNQVVSLSFAGVASAARTSRGGFYLYGNATSVSLRLQDGFTYSMYPEITYATQSISYHVSSFSYVETNLRHIGMLLDNVIEDALYSPDVTVMERPTQKLDDTAFAAIVYTQNNLKKRLLGLAEGDDVEIIETRKQNVLEIIDQTREAILFLRQFFAGRNDFFAGVVIEGIPFYAFQMTQSAFLPPVFSTSLINEFGGEIVLLEDVDVFLKADHSKGSVFSIQADSFWYGGARRTNTSITYPALSLKPAPPHGIYYTASTFYRETAVVLILNPSTSITLG